VIKIFVQISKDIQLKIPIIADK